MTDIQVYNDLLELSKNEMRELIRAAGDAYEWLLTDESEKALGEIAIIAVGIAIKGLPMLLAIPYAIKAYSEKLEVS